MSKWEQKFKNNTLTQFNNNSNVNKIHSSHTRFQIVKFSKNTESLEQNDFTYILCGPVGVCTFRFFYYRKHSIAKETFHFRIINMMIYKK